MIQPGLERIAKLLQQASFPWRSIHVAGTNGKGSICHLASSLLTHRRIKTGRFTSPHLVDRWDCISIDNEVVDESLFRKVEAHYTNLSLQKNINASSFEILTATAFHIFTESRVDIGVVEVGLGGKLDATNILDNQIVSVISKIGRDHEGFLGNSLEEIAKHKAGILRPKVPYIVNPSNEMNVKNVITQYAQEIWAGTQLNDQNANMRELYHMDNWKRLNKTLLPFQRDNAILAILAVKQAARALKFNYHNDKLATHLVSYVRHKSHAGRQQYVPVPAIFGSESQRRVLVDGAHNPDAAKELSSLVAKTERRRQTTGDRPLSKGHVRPVTWVLAMTEGKDSKQYLEQLLEPHDNVVATTYGPVDGMPWVKPMDPQQLLDKAQSIHSGIMGITVTEPDPLRALSAAKALAGYDHSIVLTGSLYLIGDFHRSLRVWEERRARGEVEHETSLALLKDMKQMQDEERHRVNHLLSSLPTDTHICSTAERPDHPGFRDRRRLLQEQLEAIDREMISFAAEHSIIPAKKRSSQGQRQRQRNRANASLARPEEDKPLRIRKQMQSPVRYMKYGKHGETVLL
ncbi:folylpolyglutamate synthase [Coniothyrium glycines]